MSDRCTSLSARMSEMTSPLGLKTADIQDWLRIVRGSQRRHEKLVQAVAEMVDASLVERGL